MRFPEELWPDPLERDLAQGLAITFEDQPLVLTDKLANSVYLTPAAEALLGDRAEALVNRLSLSLLGYGHNERIPPGLVEAMMGEAQPWRGIVPGAGPGKRWFLEASAVRRGPALICGVLRIRTDAEGAVS